MACVPGCEPDILSTEASAAPPLPVRMLYISADETVLCYNTQGIQKWDITDKSSPVFDSVFDNGNYTGCLMGTDDAVLCTLRPQAFTASEIPGVGSAGTYLTLNTVDSTTSPPSTLGEYAVLCLTCGPTSGFAVAMVRALNGSLYVLIHDDGYVIGAGNGNDSLNRFDISDPTNITLVEGQGYFREFSGVVETTFPHPLKNIIIDPADAHIVYLLGRKLDGTGAGGSPPLPGADAVFVYDLNSGTVLGFIYLGTGISASPSSTALVSSSLASPPTWDQPILTDDSLLIFGILDSGTSTLGFAIVDVSDPTSLSILSITPLDSTSSAVGCYVKDTFLFIHYNTPDSRLDVWDISDPSSPQNCKELDETGLSAYPAVFVDTESHAYVGFADSWGIYDVATCLSPTPPEEGQFVACQVLGGFLFVADNGGPTLQVYNVEDPALPVLIATLDLDAPPTDLDIQDSVIAIAAGTKVYYVTINDITDPQIAATRDL